MKRVLLIDDEDNPMRYYARALRILGFDVVHCHTTDEARGALDRSEERMDGVILDIMMPPGEFFRGEDTQKGTATGALLFHQIRKRRANVPVLVLTNVTAPE